MVMLVGLIGRQAGRLAATINKSMVGEINRLTGELTEGRMNSQQAS